MGAVVVDSLVGHCFTGKSRWQNGQWIVDLHMIDIISQEVSIPLLLVKLGLQVAGLFDALLYRTTKRLKGKTHF